MLYHVRLDGCEYAIELERRNPGWRVCVNGRELALDIAALEAGCWSFLSEDGAAAFRVRPGNAGEWILRAGSREWRAEIQDPRRRAAHADIHSTGRLRLVSPMFGRVLRVPVQPGAALTAGDELMTIEAMKMQNPIRSPRAGTLLSVAVEPGSVVAAGDLLAEIE